jgi:pimeloyl-ACP methyl ester carboxylesterase
MYYLLRLIVSALFFINIFFTQPGEDKVFIDFKTEEFNFMGREAKIVFPKTPDKEGNWIWRARFWGHEPQVDKALLSKGFHLAYVDVAGLYGNQEAVEIWNRFYEFVTAKYKLSPKVVLEGMSRGGLIIYNWASQNTDKVLCIYADAPVCDIKSWPGGLFRGTGTPASWVECLQAYKLDENSVLDFEGIPLNTCVNIAKAGIPVIHVCGDSDEVVPYEENTELLAKKFREAGGEIKIILKEGVGHHPHSLEDPTPIVDFILSKIRLTK